MLILLTFGAFVIDRVYRTTNTTSNKMQIVATFYPLGEFAQVVGGELVSVTVLVPPGSEPHDFEPTPKQIANLLRSQIFIYNGAGFERWVDKILPQLQAKNIPIINASSTVSLEAADRTQVNPHFWLDPVLAQHEVAEIRDTLMRIDPIHVETYKKNASQYLSQLSALDAEIRTGLTNCNKRMVIASHDAFGYYAKRYDIEVTAISGLSPDDEPSPAKMAAIANLARTNNIKYIFFESLVTPRLSDTIAMEVGAQTLVFNPLEGLSSSEITMGKNYFSIQKDNLQNLKTALECN